MTRIETILTLSTALTCAGAVQIVVTCVFAFAFSQFMSVLHCNIPTSSGLLAGFITVPTVVQLRTSQMALIAARKHGYTIWYKRLAIGTCTLFETAACLLTLINLLTFQTCDAAFREVMQAYGDRQCAKSIVDNVQWFMQCCGAHGYRDWYEMNWGNFIIDPFLPIVKRQVDQLLSSDTDDYPDLSMVRNDAVPFSCCAEIASSACVHQNLEQFQTYTINTQGCAQQLDNTKITILCTELTIYTLVWFIEILMMYQLLRTSDDYEKKHRQYVKIPSETKFKSFHIAEKKEFSKFLNENISTPTEI